MAKKKVFEEVRFLGRGGFAKTVQAKVVDPAYSRKWGVDEVAIKIPFEDNQCDFMDEAQLGVILHHKLQLASEEEKKNIIIYFGFATFEDEPVLVMEYVKGGNLRTLMGGNIWQKRKFAVNEAVNIACGILNGMSTLHKIKIIHRDIKPENILMDGNIPKISDFGISKMLVEDKEAKSRVGTWIYMSPELITVGTEKGVTFNTDIWSFGVTFYEMLCARFPFGITEKTLLYKGMSNIVDTKIVAKFPKYSGVPQPLQAVVLKALDKNPKTRYQNADEILSDINEYLKTEGDGEIELIAEKAYKLFNSGKFRDSEIMIQSIIEKYPKNKNAYLSTGRYYSKRQRCHDALDYFQMGIKLDPKCAAFYKDMSVAFLAVGKKREALKAIKMGIGLGLKKTPEVAMLIKVCGVK